jgi:hypothetical protein
MLQLKCFELRMILVINLRKKVVYFSFYFNLKIAKFFFRTLYILNAYNLPCFRQLTYYLAAHAFMEILVFWRNWTLLPGRENNKTRLNESKINFFITLEALTETRPALLHEKHFHSLWVCLQIPVQPQHLSDARSTLNLFYMYGYIVYFTSHKEHSVLEQKQQFVNIV